MENVLEFFFIGIDDRYVASSTMIEDEIRYAFNINNHALTLIKTFSFWKKNTIYRCIKNNKNIKNTILQKMIGGPPKK